MIGRTVSHYRILELLGIGGMGEVYRAEDRELRREIALKVFPERLSADPERLERFQREARSLAALNHPNIVTVFSIEKDQGLDFLTMELIEGQTLTELIPERGLGIDRFFELAVPLVDAISAAHAEGIVHRDIKPSNVMVTRDARLKVLDFGLAKLSRTGETDIESTLSTVSVTTDHRILGTLAYMSPEQIQGQPVDHRSDIFSLGVLLFQMATGRRPFAGGTSMELLSAVLKDRPPSVTDLRPALPPHLARILRHCLKKDREERHQSARDLRFELQELREELKTGEAVSSAIEVVRPPKKRGRLPILVALAGAAALIAFLVWRPWGSRAGTSQEAQIAVPAITWPSEERNGRISPDGHWLSFLSDRGGLSRLWVRRLEGGEARALTSEERMIDSHAWSPAGDEIALLVRGQDGKKVEVIPSPLGGSPRLSLDVPDLWWIAEWVASTVYLESASTLSALDLGTGELAEVRLPENGFEFLRHFDVSADGRTVLFSAVRDGREDVWRFDMDSNALEAVTDDGAKATYPHCADRACSTVAYLSNRTGQTDVWFAESDGSRQMKVPARVESISDVSLGGRSVALQVLMEDANLWFWDGRSRRHEPLTVDSLADFGVSSAPSTSVLAFQRASPATDVQSRFLDAHVVLSSLEEGHLSEPRRLAEGYAPVLSRDGRMVAFLRMASSGPYFTELWAGEVDSGRTMLLSDRFQMTGFWEWPADLLARNLVWAAEDELLWVEAGSDAVPEIGKAVFSDGTPSLERLAVPAEGGGLIQDLLWFRDSGELSFVLWSTSESLWEVKRHRGAEGTETVYSETLPQGSLRLLGSSADGARMYLLKASPDANGVETVELFELEDGGEIKPLATVDRTFAATARFDEEAGRILMSAAMDGAYNIISLDVATGALKQITGNRLPGIIFCGLAPLDGAGLVYSRHQRNADLWLLRRDIPAAEIN